MKWVFYVIVFGYMFYRAVFGQILTVEPENNDGFLEVGEHKTISCKASNKNQKVKWIDPKGNEIQRVPSGRVFSQQHFVKGRIPALILTITKASIQDTGVYQCRSGELLKNVSICVIDPSEFIDTPTEVTADLGRSITLTCQAKGEPEPRLLWSRNDQTVTDEDSSDKYKVMTKYNIQGFEGLLTITSLDPEDSGIYSCLSLQESVQNENCNHIKTLNITLNVNYAPIFENGNETENVYSKSNQEVQIECSASGYPKPTYKWFKESDDGVLFEYDQKQIKIIQENKAALSIFANHSTFGGRYKCVASNDIGTSTKYFILMQMMKPRRPSEVHLYDSTENSVKLNVTWYDEIIFPVAAIEVHYIKDNNQRRSVPSSWKSADSIEVEINNVDPEEQGIIFTVPGLETATEYWVRLRAKNDAGESAWSDPSFVTTSVQELVTVSFDSTTEAPIEEEEDPESSSDDDVSDATFYGIFFAGGVLVLAVACTFLMRLVK